MQKSFVIKHDPKTIRWCANEVTKLAGELLNGNSQRVIERGVGCSGAADMLIEYALKLEEMDRDFANEEKGEVHKFREREDG